MSNRAFSFRLNAIAAVSLALSGLAMAGSAQATTFHVRTDGGDASQCTGRADAAYSGSGTGQACAWKHPFFALTPGGGKRIAGSDTVIIGSGTYLIGAGAPGSNNCSGTGCYMPAIPSGTTTAKTRFVGKSASAPAKLVGNNGSLVLNLQGSSNVEIGNLEITDQNDCVYQHSNSTANCSGTNWAKTGLSARASSNVWMHDVNIHGMGHQGMLAAGLTNWTVERVKLVANGRTGWEGNIGSAGNSSNAGNIILRDIEIGWNGCGERWQTGTPWACWAQQTGGNGDGLGTTYTGGKWLIEDAFIHHNTADGLDLRYADGADGTSVTVRRLYAVGNAGNQVKIRGNSTIENSVIVGTCGYFKDKYFMVAADNCRANGNSLQLVMTPNDVATVRHNTITGEGGVLIGANEGDSSGRIYIQNNIAVGFKAFPYSDGRLAAFYYANAAPAPVSYSGNLIWTVNGNTCPSGSICGQNPKLTNMTLAGFDAELLSGSPAIDRAPMIAAVTTDFLSGQRPYGPANDIGAYEYGAAGVSTPTPTPTPDPVCTRAAPTLTMSGPTTAVAAGTMNTYSVALRNNDTSACSNSSFSLARTVASGWTGTLSTTSIALAPGASGSASLKVTSPTTATEGGYGVGVGTSSSVGSVHTASASAIYNVAKPAEATPSLTTVATTLEPTYAPGAAMRIFGLVKNNGVVMEGITVQFMITQPNGVTTQNSSVSGSDGYARASHTASLVPGTHWLAASWSYGGQTSTGVVSFEVESPDSLSTVATTLEPSYEPGAAMRIFALVKNNGVVLEGINVSFVITQPDGQTTQNSSVSGSDGYARASHTASLVPGTHYLKATWSYGGQTSSGVVSFEVKAPAVSLSTVATTLEPSYEPGAAMRIFALVKNNGVVLEGVNVSFVITQPDGQTTQNSAISGSDGYARASHTASLVPGTHTLKATWSYGGQTSTDVVSFEVRAPVSLSTEMTTNKSAYKRGEAMRLFALVKNNGVVLQGVSVDFVITQPDGRTTQVTSVSGSDGYARASHAASNVRGTHYLRGTWSYGGKTSSGVVSFRVR